LWEDETAAAEFAPLLAKRWPATVQPPVPEREDEHVRKPGSAPEDKSSTGVSLCEGTAATSKPTDAISARVMTLLMIIPSVRFQECLPVRCATTVGVSKTTI